MLQYIAVLLPDSSNLASTPTSETGNNHANKIGFKIEFVVELGLLCL